MVGLDKGLQTISEVSGAIQQAGDRNLTERGEVSTRWLGNNFKIGSTNFEGSVID